MFQSLVWSVRLPASSSMRAVCRLTTVSSSSTLASILARACSLSSNALGMVRSSLKLNSSLKKQQKQTKKTEKSFSRPDVSGSQPQNEAIDKEKTLDSCLKTTIEVEKILDILSKKWNTIVSQDPGRYICNYTLYSFITTQTQLTIFFFSSYRSLQECKKHSHVQSIFCHVPNPELVPVEKQKEFACDLIHAITSIYQ